VYTLGVCAIHESVYRTPTHPHTHTHTHTHKYTTTVLLTRKALFRNSNFAPYTRAPCTTIICICRAEYITHVCVYIYIYIIILFSCLLYSTYMCPTEEYSGSVMDLPFLHLPSRNSAFPSCTPNTTASA